MHTRGGALVDIMMGAKRIFMLAYGSGVFSNLVIMFISKLVQYLK